MPQASDEVRELMEGYFGDPIDDTGPHQYLEAQGFVCTRGWEWFKPGIVTLGQLTEKEWHCVLFLITEWDYGGLKPDRVEAVDCFCRG